MARPHSSEIEIIPEVARVLSKIITSGKTEQRYVKRTQLLFRISQGGANNRIAQELGINYKTVKKWRLRYIASSDIFDKILEQSDKTEKLKLKELEEYVYQLLSDLARSGAPMTFTALQYCQLMELALEKPEKYDRPINDWTSRELRDEAVKQGIFETISITQVGNFLKRSRS